MENIWLIAVLALLGVLFLSAAAYLLLIGSHITAEKKEKLSAMTARSGKFAHRGLFDNTGPNPENSLKAFAKAVNAGFGIELDTQTSSDGQVIVHHDFSLKRSCGQDLRVKDLTLSELRSYKLFSSQERIPLFSDVLKIIDGKVPLLVEIKVEHDYLRTAEQTARILDSYKGPYIIESFNPMVLAWFRKNRPEVIRGQLTDDFVKTHELTLKPIERFALTQMLMDFKARPDFVSCEQSMSKKTGIRLLRNIFRIPMFAWTIRSESESERAKPFFGFQIFDSFIPSSLR